MKRNFLKIGLVAIGLATFGVVQAGTANLSPNGTTLLITGTPKADQIHISGSYGYGSLGDSGPDCITVFFDGDYEDDADFYACGIENIVVAGMGGWNRTTFDNVNIAGDAEVKGGAKTDTVFLRGSNWFGGDLVLTLRAGNNYIHGTLGNVNGLMGTGHTHVHGDLDISTGAGNDVANFRDLHVVGTADMFFGAGDDKANIWKGDGGNVINKLFMRLGSGENLGSVRHTMANSRVQVFGGPGADDITLKELSAYEIDVILNAGDDSLQIKGNVSASGLANAQGGAGDADDICGDMVGSPSVVNAFETYCGHPIPPVADMQQ